MLDLDPKEFSFRRTVPFRSLPVTCCCVAIVQHGAMPGALVAMHFSESNEVANASRYRHRLPAWKRNKESD